MTGIRRTLPGSERDGPQSPSGATGEAPAIDRAHLSRQCFGDERLEAELLSLFRTQSPLLAAQIGQAAGLAPASAADLAHRLKGAALAVGAGRVARAAAIVEACGRAAERAGPLPPAEAAKMSQALSELGGAVSDAVAEIERLEL